MKHNTKIHIAVLIDKDIPTDHSFIQGIFENCLLKHDVNVTFIGFRNENIPQKPQVKYVFIKGMYSNFILRKLHKLISFALAVFKSKPSVLFTRNDPVYLIIGWLAKLRLPQLIHVHQVSHLHAYSSSLQSSFLFRIKSFGDKQIRILFLKATDMICVISDEMKRFLIKEWPAHTQKLRVYPLGVHEADFRESKSLEERDVDLIYIGTFAKSRQLNIVVDAINSYQQKYGSINVVFLGGSHNQEDDQMLENYAKNIDMPHPIQFIGKLSRKEALQQLANAKIGLSMIPSHGLFKQISPTKLMEYLAAGCFVIASKGIVDQENILKNAPSGELVDFDPDKIVEAIHRGMNNLDNSNKSAKNGREYILKHREYDTMAKRLIQDILQLKN